MNPEFHYRGRVLRLSIYGGSHECAIGVRCDGLPAGEAVDESALRAFLARRAPGRNPWSTARREPDEPVFLAGLNNFVTDGAPLRAEIRNTDTRSGDYAALRDVPRPMHADFTAPLRYGGGLSMAGGGPFSGRMTAPLCILGGVCLQILAKRGITVGAHALSIGGVQDAPFDPLLADAEALRALSAAAFPVLDAARGAQMRAEIERAHLDGDSAGGVVECAAIGLPAGLGGALFDGMESAIAALAFAIPAVKGVDFGAGFAAAALRGSAHNDAFCVRAGQVRTETNRHGGILGGITTGMPLLFRAAFKPTPSIARAQQSVSLSRLEPAQLSIPGRHDPCIVPRAVPVVEAVCAIAVLDALLERSEHGAD